MNKKIMQYLTASALAIMVAGCASTGANGNSESALESYNRTMFGFNYRFDKYIMKPIAKGYRAITNDFIRERVRGALSNLREPLSAGNFLLQADPEKTATSLSRFVINSTLGLGGMFDVADGWGLKKDRATFNETFAKWCVPQGPFIVLPFFGPSTPRAATGMVLEFVFDPVFWTTYHNANVRDKVAYSYAALQAITLREENLELLDELERDSVDFYATMRSAYLQNQSRLKCFNDTNSSENTYDFDFGTYDEDEAFDEMEAQ